MEVYRLAAHAYQDLTGDGGLYAGGRWHKKGNKVIYTASSRALASAERLVHETIEDMPKLSMLTIWIPDEASLLKITEKELPDDWDLLTNTASTQHIGTNWLKSKSHLLLHLPSVVVRGDFNVLINPTHPDINTVKIVESHDYYYDARLQKIIR